MTCTRSTGTEFWNTASVRMEHGPCDVMIYMTFSRFEKDIYERMTHRKYNITR